MRLLGGNGGYAKSSVSVTRGTNISLASVIRGRYALLPGNINDVNCANGGRRQPNTFQNSESPRPLCERQKWQTSFESHYIAC